MKMTKTVAAVVVILLLSASAVFAAGSTARAALRDGAMALRCAGCGLQTPKMPANSAERSAPMRERIAQQLAAGRITQAEADAALAGMEAQAAKCEAFKSLTPEEKKAKLIEYFSAKIEERVNDGKITADKAKEMIAEYTEKISAWDGTTPRPGIMPLNRARRGGMFGRQRLSIPDALGKAVNDGVITQDQADAILEYLK